MTKKRVSRRLIFIAIWNNKISTSLLGEIMVPPCFALRPRVFHWDPVFSTRPRVFHQTPCFPHPVFSTPRVFHTPGPRTPYYGTPAPRFPPSLSGNIEAVFFILGTRNIYRKKENNNKNKKLSCCFKWFLFFQTLLTIIPINIKTKNKNKRNRKKVKENGTTLLACFFLAFF